MVGEILEAALQGVGRDEASLRQAPANSRAGRMRAATIADVRKLLRGLGVHATQEEADAVIAELGLPVDVASAIPRPPEERDPEEVLQGEGPESSAFRSIT